MGSEPNTKNKRKNTIMTDSPSKKKNNEKQLSKKQDEESDSNEDSEHESEEEDSGEGDMDMHEYRKFLQKIFPSKYLKDKIETDEKVVKKDKKTTSPKKKKRVVEEEESEEEEEDSDDEDEVEEITSKKNNKFNIIFTIGDPHGRKGKDYDEDDSDSEDESEEDSDYEDEDESEYEDEDEESESEYEESESDDDEHVKSKKKSETAKKDNEYYEKEIAILDTYIKDAEKQLETNKKSKIIKEMIDVGKDKRTQLLKLQVKSQKKERGKNLTKFKKTLRGKNPMNDYAYFKKLDVA